MVNQFMTKQTRIYNGENTVSSVSGSGKTGQLHLIYIYIYIIYIHTHEARAFFN